MNDKLKQFIDENRDAFDSEEPSPQLYKKLKLETGSREHTSRFRNWNPLRWVAIVAGLILLSAGLYLVLDKKNTEPGLIKNQPVIIEEEPGIGDPVYAKQIYHFKELIGLKQEELKQLKKDYPELYNQFVGDINQLDSAYQSLKINLAKNPNREMLLEAMIQNLQLQSELLNRQLLIIKEIKQKNRSHEKNNI